MTALLDVNVLIALIDPFHSHNDRAHDWFARNAASGWASCPLTENGAIRVFGHSRYPLGPGSPAAAAQLMAGLFAHEGRAFWPNEFSLLSDPNVDCGRLGSASQVTDTYLLALAVRRGGKLATFDRRLSGIAVTGGSEALSLID